MVWGEYRGCEKTAYIALLLLRQIKNCLIISILCSSFPNAHLEHYFDLYSFRINFYLQNCFLLFYAVIKVNQIFLSSCRFLLILDGKKKSMTMMTKEKQEWT